MSAIFDAYESELLMLLSQISQLCETHLKRAELKKLLEKADALSQQMKIELHGVDSNERKALSIKVQDYQDKIRSLAARFEKSANSSSHTFVRDETPARDQMKDATIKLMGTTEKLSEAKRAAAEIEEVAVTITDALGRNKNQIEDAHLKVKSVLDSQQHGGSIIRRMLSRDRRQRVALFVLAATIIVGALLILYFKFGYRKSEQDRGVHPVEALH
ncbi:unnamed protein product [Albugo candida]|uniref:Vesicle transport v-SNARE N-terminal domain-containing protein n=1 Tax=Albugo candida TaxID=65357 RepID=A0A024G087_9STRA|nr:unnamed protein product [Albugo candida]|eukprot:CCI39730.1 unnamed protein product [Albugo candida]